MPTRPEFVNYKERLCACWCETLGDDNFHHDLLAAFRGDAGACDIILNAMDFFAEEFNARLDNDEDVFIAYGATSDLVNGRLNEHRERRREFVMERMRQDVNIVCAMRAVIVLNERFNADDGVNWIGDADAIFDVIECNCPGNPQPQYIPAWAHLAPRI